MTFQSSARPVSRPKRPTQIGCRSLHGSNLVWLQARFDAEFRASAPAGNLDRATSRRSAGVLDADSDRRGSLALERGYRYAPGSAVA